MKKFRITVIMEGGKLKQPKEETVEVEAESASPEGTTAAFNKVYAKEKGKGYRFRFGEIHELSD